MRELWHDVLVTVAIFVGLIFVSEGKATLFELTLFLLSVGLVMGKIQQFTAKSLGGMSISAKSESHTGNEAEPQLEAAKERLSRSASQKGRGETTVSDYEDNEAGGEVGSSRN